MTIAPGTRLGTYEITSPLGRGGMGEVYRARDARLKRDVAIKLLPDGFARDEERVARFEREAQALASLNHPNIGSIYGIAEHGDSHFLVLELVEGQTLADRIAHGPVTTDEALRIARQLIDALDAAHEKGSSIAI
jgi:serine/threonine protein kinase